MTIDLTIAINSGDRSSWPSPTAAPAIRWMAKKRRVCPLLRPVSWESRRRRL